MQYAGSPTLVDAIFPEFKTQSRVAVVFREAALMFGFAGMVALMAQIELRLPWTPVPITGQTFGVLVAGGALGMRRGMGSMLIYALAGMFLLPVFAPMGGTTSGTWDLHFILPWAGTEAFLWNLASGGYIVGFILAAGLVGYFAERHWDRGPWVQATMLAGTILIYVPGLLWLGYLITTDWTVPGGSAPLSELLNGSSTIDKTLRAGLYPFVVGDLMKLMAASLVLPTAWALTSRIRGNDRLG